MEGGGFAQKKGWMWLELQRPLRSAKWVECWFVVDAGHLRFYDDAASRKAIGDIALSEAEVTKCPRVDYFAFRLEDLRRSRKYVLAAETEAESLNWAESLLEHGASGLLRALSVKPKASMSFKSFSRRKAAVVHENDAAGGSFKSFKSFGSRKTREQAPERAKVAEPPASQVPVPDEQGATEAAAAGRRRERCVQFMDVDEPPTKRISLGLGM